MNQDRWNQLENLFEAAIEIPAGERAGFIERACPDAELAEELNYLVSCHEEAGDTLERPAADRFPELCLPQAPHRVGPYAIVRCLGRGGMGAVYLARRADDQYRQTVAVKIVSRALDYPELLARFRKERQILAHLNHPNIARLLDGGTTEDGQPYLVMEYVEGEPIDRWCAARRLLVCERLALFRTACAAVEQAHREHVIHRDIKPSNILVTAEGIPKLLDFGIAKLSAAVGDEAAETTSPLCQFLTPDYASPEQVRGEPVTAASDVYSLGVLLCVLLTGEHPYVLPLRTPLELARAAAEDEPKIAQNASLGCDLRNIILKALAKQPARRYASVAQLSEDIGRYLEGFPVLACPDSVSYRCGKFLRRHKAGAIAAAGVTLMLLAGISATLRQTRSARFAAGRAAAEAARAEQNLNEVLTLADSLLFEQEDGVGTTTQVRAVMIQDALHYLDRFSNQDGTSLSLRRELATAYLRLGDVQGKPYAANVGNTAGALASYQKALAILQPLAQTAPKDAETQLALSNAHEAIGSLETRRMNYDRAREHLRRALALREQLLGADLLNPRLQRVVALSCLDLGDTVQYQGSLKEANGFYLRALTILIPLAARSDAAREARQELTKAYQRVAANLDSTGFELSTAMGYPESAQDAFRQAFEYARKALENAEVLAASSPGNARLRRAAEDAASDAARMLSRTGRHSEALALYRGALLQAEALSSQDPANAEARSDLFILYRDLAMAEERAGDGKSAERDYRNAVQIGSALLQNDRNNSEMLAYLLIAYDYLRELHRKSGDLPAAFEDMRQEGALIDRRAPLAGYSVSRKWGYMAATAGLLARAGKTEEARRLGSQALSLGKEIADRPDSSAEELIGYAWPLITSEPASLRDPRAALEYGERALRRQNPPGIRTLQFLALAYYENHQDAAAAEAMRRALDMLPYPIRERDDASVLRHIRRALRRES